MDIPVKRSFRESSLFSAIVSKTFPYKVIMRPSVERRYGNIINNQLNKNTTILITGETGVGKEALAHYIHEHSSRNDRPLFIVDVPASPEPLIESELFGHERGAYTGAIAQRIGVLERANGATIFLDEIGDISLSAQTKLLRALESKNFNRIGGNNTVRSDFRLICGTNKNLKKEIQARRFREDLYYRINVIPIHIPSLMEEPTDICYVAEIFLNECCSKHHVDQIEYADLLKELTEKYNWPGNLREMRNTIETIVTNYNGGNCDLKALFFMGKEDNHINGNEQLSKKQRILLSLKQANGNKAKAAKIYKCSRKNFYLLMHKHNIPLNTYNNLKSQ